MSRRVGIFYEPEHEKHRYKDDSQPDLPERVSIIWRNLVEKGLDKLIVRIKNGREATIEELALVHNEAFIEELEEIPNLSKDELEKLEDRFKSKWSELTYKEIYLTPESWKVTRLAVGGLLETIDLVVSGRVDNAFALCRPPGHHATACMCKGFCVVNNVAIGARYALEKGYANKVLIVDWDVHHGNGTQDEFYQEDQVLYISTHRHEEDMTHYPGLEKCGSTFIGEGQGLGFNINIPFQANIPFSPDVRSPFGDNEMLYVFYKIILPVAHEFQPDLVLVSSGFDASDGDPVGDCCVHPETYGRMTSHLTKLANGKVIVVMEGGYNFESNAKCGESVTRALFSNITPSIPELKETDIIEGFRPTVQGIIKTQSPYWKSLKN